MGKLSRRFVLPLVCSAILLLSASGVARAEELIYKGGYFNGGTLSVSNSDGTSKKTVGSTFFLSCERALEINESFELGYAAGFQMSGQSEGGLFLSRNQCIPVYLLLNYYPLSIEGTPYFTGHLGYNFMMYDVDDYDGYLHGLYYAFGAGLRVSGYPSIRVELLYIVNTGSGEVENFWDDRVDKIKVTQSRLSLALGFGF